MTTWKTSPRLFLFLAILFTSLALISRFDLHRRSLSFFQNSHSHCLLWQPTSSCPRDSQISSIVWTHSTSGLIKYLQWIAIRKISNIRITHFDNDCSATRDYHYNSTPSSDQFIQVFIIPLSANFVDRSQCALKIQQVSSMNFNHIYYSRKSTRATLFYEQLDALSANQTNFTLHFNHSLTANVQTISNYLSTMKWVSLHDEDFVHPNLTECEKQLRYLFSLFKLNQSHPLIEYDSHQFVSDGTWWDHSQVAEHLINQSIPLRSPSFSYVDDFYYLHGKRTFLQYLYDNRRCYRQGIFGQMQSEIKPNRTSTDVPDRCASKRFDCAFSDIYSFSDREEIYAEFDAQKELNAKPLKCAFAVPSVFDQVRKRYGRNHTCQTIVFTSITNCYDTLPEVNGKILPSFCFVALLDTKTANVYEKLYANKAILPWDFVDLGPVATPFSIAAKTAETVKIVGQHLFPLAKWIIWLDGKGRLNNIGDGLAQFQSPFVGAPHPDAGRTSASEVAPTIGRIGGREAPGSARLINSVADIQIQEKEYQRDGFYRRSDELQLKMYDIAVFLYRNHHPCITRYLCAWHNEINYYSYRGQLSVYYSAVRFNFTAYLALLPGQFYATVGHQHVC